MTKATANKYKLWTMATKKCAYLVALVLLLGACDTKEAPAQTDTVVQTDSDDGAHRHEYNLGEQYLCQNGDTVSILAEENEGEIEIHAIIQDTEYELHPDSEQEDYYIAHDEGIGGEPMALILTDNHATFTRLSDNSPLLACQKQH